MSTDSQMDDVTIEPAGPMPIKPGISAPEANNPAGITDVQVANSSVGNRLVEDSNGKWHRLEYVDGHWVQDQNWYTKLWSKRPFRDSVHRATNTFAQTVIASSAVSGVVNAGLEDIRWTRVLSIAGLATIMSLLQSVCRYTKTDDE